MQEVAAGIADTGMSTLDTSFRFLSVFTELGFAAHRLLCLTQRILVPIKAVEGVRNAPSESVAKRVMPISMPTAPTTTVGQTLYEFG